MSSSWSARAAMACLLLLAAGCSRQAAPHEQANAAAAAAGTPVAGAVDRSHRGETLPAARLTGLDGAAVTLTAYRGRPLLVNLWATWCAPCVAELPSLDRAAGALAAVAIDQGEGADKVGPFLAARHLAHLRPLLDHEMTVSMTLPANLPTTILYGGDGKEVWRVAGGRDWGTAESARLLTEAR